MVCKKLNIAFGAERVKEDFYQIILEWDKQIMDTKDFKVWVFFLLSDATVTKFLHRM